MGARETQMASHKIVNSTVFHYKSKKKSDSIDSGVLELCKQADPPVLYYENSMKMRPPNESKAPPIMSIKEAKEMFPNYFPPKLAVTYVSDSESDLIFDLKKFPLSAPKPPPQPPLGVGKAKRKK